jgi:hypothetical protein
MKLGMNITPMLITPVNIIFMAAVQICEVGTPAALKVGS